MPSYTQYKRQMAVLDADDSEIESWITVRGNHIPIMKGQSKGDAVKAFIEHQAGKNDVPQGTKWTPTNKKGEGTGNKPKQEKPKYDIRHGARVPDIESYINEYADRHTPNSWREEENFIAEKLKQDGLYAYGSDIKKAMKNVYGDVYEQERAEEVRLDKTQKKQSKPSDASKGGSQKKEYNPDYETLKKELAAVGGERNLGLLGAAEKERRGLTQEYNNLFEESKRVKSAIKSEVDLVKRNELKAKLKEIKNKMEDNLSESRNITEKAVSVWNEGKKKESKPSDSSKGGSTSQPKDIHDWKFEDVMKLKSSDPRVHKYIAENFGVSKATVAILGEVLPTEDLYFKVHALTNMYGEGWDRTSGGKRLRDMERDAAGVAKLVSENPDKFGYDY